MRGLFEPLDKRCGARFGFKNSWLQKYHDSIDQKVRKGLTLELYKSDLDIREERPNGRKVGVFHQTENFVNVTCRERILDCHRSCWFRSIRFINHVDLLNMNNT